MKEQLTDVSAQTTALSELVAGPTELHNQQQEWNKTMSSEFQTVSSRLVSTDTKTAAAHTAAKLADSIARRSADMAGKALQATVSYQNQLKTIEIIWQPSRKHNSLSPNRSTVIT